MRPAALRPTSRGVWSRNRRAYSPAPLKKQETYRPVVPRFNVAKAFLLISCLSMSNRGWTRNIVSKTKEIESLEAKQGEKMIEVKLRFWTNDISPEDGKVVPKHAWTSGVVRMEKNKSHE